MTVERGITFGLAGIVLALVLGLAWQNHSHTSRVVDLQNQIAGRDLTVEVQKGVYSKLAMEADGFKALLSSQDEQLKFLKKEVESRKAEILTATTMALAWKKAYEGEAEANQTEIPDDGPPEPGAPSKPPRLKVDFKKDFGPFIVSGHTITSPPEAFVAVKQGKPIKISLVVSEEPDGSWRTYATSSDENISIDIGLSAVNPRVIEEKWYEKIGFTALLGFGAQPLAGLGASYSVSQFDVGPAVYVTPAGLSYGGSVTWHPFWRK